MEKIPTIFDRDWDGHRGVIPKLLHDPRDAVATEKLDGTNVRVTVRTDAEEPGGPVSMAVAVRLEKRRNPTKEQKRDGIKEPWYVDASRDDPADRFLFEALENTSILDIPDGEWSGEAVGPKIQGNPLGLGQHRIYFFAFGKLPAEVCVPLLADVNLPTFYGSGDGWDADSDRFFSELRDYIAATPSALNPDRTIEGIVWHGYGEFYGKLKAKDFKALTPTPNRKEV